MKKRNTIAAFQQISSKTLLLVVGGGKHNYGGITMLKNKLKKHSRFGN